VSGGDIRPGTLEDNVGVRIVRLSEVFVRLARLGVERPTGLRLTDLRILNLLDGRGGVSIAELSRRTHVDKAWISRSVQLLIEQGRVERRVDPADSRVTLISLTAAGRALLDGIRPAVLTNEARVLEGIDDAAFKHDLDRLLDNAEAILAAAEAGAG